MYRKSMIKKVISMSFFVIVFIGLSIKGGWSAPPVIDRVNPTSGWPGGRTTDGTIVQGTQVIIHGQYFHPTPEMHRNQVYFTGSGGGMIAAPVEWVSLDEIDYQPDGVVADDSTVPGGLANPYGVAVDQIGNLYIADTENHRIIRMSPAGTFTPWGSHGTGNGEFARPAGIAVDESGFIYVADMLNNRIQKLDSNGTFVTAWDLSGSGVGPYDGPVDVEAGTILGTTFIYVADSNNRRVVRTDATGNNPAIFPAPSDTGRILGVCASNNLGYVYATDSVHHRILCWNWQGEYQGFYGPSDSDPDNLAVIDISFPMGIDQDFDGYVYVASNGYQRIIKFETSTADLSYFHQIAEFGIGPDPIGGPTGEDEFLDPVDIAVTDLKATYTVDRMLEKVVRYIPTDSQEIWVHVPEGAVSGPLEVRTDEGVATDYFNVQEMGPVSIRDWYLSQGIWEYGEDPETLEDRLVAGKKTIINIELSSNGLLEYHPYFWGSPVHDSALCRVFKEGEEIGQVEGVPVNLGMINGFSHENFFDIRFEIPQWLVAIEGDYHFEVSLDRTLPHYGFHWLRRFPMIGSHTFRNRKSYKILSKVISAYKVDGTRVDCDGQTHEGSFIYFGDPQHALDWLDWRQLFSGYMNYNRLFPVRHSMGDIHPYGFSVPGHMCDGINSWDPECYSILMALDFNRRRINEDTGAGYDFMLGVIDRQESLIPDVPFIGIIAGCGEPEGMLRVGLRSALISVGFDQDGLPEYDVGQCIAHELIHMHNCQEHTSVEIIASAKKAWNSFDNVFINNPVDMMYVRTPGSPPRTVERNDHFCFVNLDHYEILFDALANPHPQYYKIREVPLLQDDPSRPASTQNNFTLLGKLMTTSGEFMRVASWVGSGDTPVTPEVEGGEDHLVFFDAASTELLRWSVPISYGLQALSNGEVHGRFVEDIGFVSVTVPFPDTTARVELIVDESTVWSADVPDQGPTVNLTSPTGGEHIGPNDTLTVQWNASHPAGAEMKYTIGYSFDGGSTFKPLAVALKETTSYQFQEGALASSTGYVKIRVAASDGFNQAYDVSGDISVPVIPTQVTILQPKPGEIIPEGKAFNLLAMANNPEQGVLDLTPANTHWVLDDDVSLESGNDIKFRGTIQHTTPLGNVTMPLSLGSHIIQIKATVAPGEVISDEVQIEIVADSDQDGVPDDVEIEQGSDPTDPGDRPNHPPVANSGGDQIVEQTDNDGTDVTLNGSQSFDPDGIFLIYTWTWTGGSVNGVQPTLNLPLGITTVVLTVDDGHTTDTDTVLITIVDTTPPSITCPPNIIAEQTSADGTPVAIGNPTVSDICDVDPEVINDAPIVFPLGETIVTWTAMDASGNSSSCSQTVTVVDTTPPVIHSISASPNSLWPPNHKMVPVTVTCVCEDICDIAPVCKIISIESNQPVNDKGDGNTEPDWEITGDLSVELMAERSGKAKGDRIYTITVECTDFSGNNNKATVDVIVKHDQGKKSTQSNQGTSSITVQNGNSYSITQQDDIFLLIIKQAAAAIPTLLVNETSSLGNSNHIQNNVILSSKQEKKANQNAQSKDYKPFQYIGFSMPSPFLQGYGIFSPFGPLNQQTLFGNGNGRLDYSLDSYWGSNLDFYKPPVFGFWFNSPFLIPPTMSLNEFPF